MASEALAHLGRHDAVRGVGGAVPDGASTTAAGGAALTDDDWPAALGQADRFPGWLALFEREIADRPTASVVGEWAPRLVPGSVGAATHGLIRTGHALRALGVADTPPRRLEVATGLAFWASSYQELPGPPLLIGQEGVAGRLGRPALPSRRRARPGA